MYSNRAEKYVHQLKIEYYLDKFLFDVSYKPVIVHPLSLPQMVRDQTKGASFWKYHVHVSSLMHCMHS